jgi:hypothetical protein
MDVEYDDDEMEISLEIPMDAEPGDSLSFEVNGTQLTVEVPVASVPGEILRIKLANNIRSGEEKDKGTNWKSNDNDADDDDDNKITIEMATGSKISIVETSTSTKNTGRSTVNHENLSDGTYLHLWPASHYIIKFINSPEFRRQFQDLSVHSVMELGAGHGLLGMAFAEIVSTFINTKKPMKLVLSDVEEALSQLEANIQLNRENFGQRINISSIPLKWHSYPIPKTNSDLDFIVGSDLLYNIEAIPLLASTIRRLLSRSTKILLSVRWRKPSDERSFFILLSDIIEWKVIHGACSLDYRVYGNGCFESNKYFSQSMVGIQGKVVPLSSIDESCIEKMTTKEFEQYEELQTQVYLGEVVQRKMMTDPVQKRPKLEK